MSFLDADRGAGGGGGGGGGGYNHSNSRGRNQHHHQRQQQRGNGFGAANSAQPLSAARSPGNNGVYQRRIGGNGNGGRGGTSMGNSYGGHGNAKTPLLKSEGDQDFPQLIRAITESMRGYQHCVGDVARQAAALGTNRDTRALRTRMHTQIDRAQQLAQSITNQVQYVCTLCTLCTLCTVCIFGGLTSSFSSPHFSSPHFSSPHFSFSFSFSFSFLFLRVFIYYVFVYALLTAKEYCIPVLVLYLYVL